MTRGPATNPCGSCPYRRDVQSGIWAPEEYAKLPLYDAETGQQPFGLFLCHQDDQGDDSRVCAGWLGCHDPQELMAVRMAQFSGKMTPDDLDATWNYTTTVPLFGSGLEAQAHGLADVDDPSPKAQRVIEKIVARRDNLKFGAP